MEISHAMLEDLTGRAAQSPRGRQHLLLHDHPGAPAQKLLNALTRDSYVQPHRHRFDGGMECLVALRGAFGCIVFDDHGAVRRTMRLGIDKDEDAMIVQIAPDEWHSLVAIAAGSILMEVKDGPHDPATAKQMAPWAPAEGSVGAAAYLNWMRGLFE